MKTNNAKRIGTACAKWAATCCIAAGGLMGSLAHGQEAPPPPPMDARGPGGPGGMPPKLPSFDLLDQNQDGIVSVQEFCAGMNKLNAELFKRIDTDGDDSISKKEMETFQGRMGGRGPRPEPGSGPMPPDGQMGPPPGEMPPMGHGGGPGGRPPMPMDFDRMDTNQDHVVSVEEYYAAWNRMGREQFVRIDSNGDGVLSKEELAATARPPRPGRPGEER